MHRRTRDIAPGQYYKKAGRGGGVWEVVSVRTDASGATHARLKSVDEPMTFRTLALESIMDIRNFLPVESC